MNVIDYVVDRCRASFSPPCTTPASTSTAARSTLDTEGATIETIEPDWRYELLGIITDPNIAYILMLVGVYGLILEFYNPGTGIGGVVGIICLLLAAFALQMLPINYAGLALIIVGLALLVAEAVSPSFGIFGVGGVVAFLIGSLILMDTDLPGYQISIPIILGFTVATAGTLILIVGATIKASRSAVTTGTEAMVGGDARVLSDFEGEDGFTGRVRAFGEIWQAKSDDALAEGNNATITAVDGLTLAVRKKDS